MAEEREWDEGGKESEDERDLPQAIDLDDDNYDDTIECPHCGEAIDEDTEQCPYCRQWVTNELSGAEERSQGWFWPITVAIAVAVVLVIWSRWS